VHRHTFIYFLSQFSARETLHVAFVCGPSRADASHMSDVTLDAN
jgi:hypothetical protein